MIIFGNLKFLKQSYARINGRIDILIRIHILSYLFLAWSAHSPSSLDDRVNSHRKPCSEEDPSLAWSYPMTSRTSYDLLALDPPHVNHRNMHELHLINNLHKHYSTVYLLSGLNVSIFDKRSAAWGLMLGNNLSQLCLLLLGNDLMYFIAF